MLDYNIAKTNSENVPCFGSNHVKIFLRDDYIDLLLQKIYHPTEEDNQKDEILKLSSLR